jgi:tetratricopeptide (TPR) repeat protein
MVLVERPNSRLGLALSSGQLALLLCALAPVPALAQAAGARNPSKAGGGASAAREAPRAAEPTAPPVEAEPIDRRLEKVRQRLDALAFEILSAQARMLELQEDVVGAEERPGPAASPAGAVEGDPALERSRRWYQQGKERYRAGDHARAFVLLEAADAGWFKNTSDHPAALFLLGEASRRLRLWSTALGYYRSALKVPSSPHAPEALVGALECALHLGDFAGADELVTWARGQWGEAGLPPEAVYLWGRVALRRRDVPPEKRDPVALAILAKVAGPFQMAAAYYRGAIHVQSGDLWSAAKEFEACDRVTPETPRQAQQRELCWFALGRVYGELENWSEAIGAYQRVPRGSPRFGDAVYETSWTYEKAGLYAAALQAIDSIPDPGPDSPLAAEAALLRGKILGRLGRYPEAVRVFDGVRRRYAPALESLDAVLLRERDPARYQEWLAPGRGPAREGASEPPPLAVAWARTADAGGPGLDVAASLDTAQRAFDGTRTASARLDAVLGRSWPESLRARAATERQALADGGRELALVRGEAEELLGQKAHRSFVAVRLQLQRLILKADRGIVEVALARNVDVRGNVRSLIFRRAVEDRLPMPTERRAAIAAQLEKRGRSLDEAERRSRQEAIGQLEDYVRRYPEDPVYTPEALARLGELQYEKAEESAARPPGRPTDSREPARAAAPRPFSPQGCVAVVPLYQRLATGFPGYQKRDEVYLLLGYCLGEMGRNAEAIQVYADLVRLFPGSPHAPEAWVRLGDLSFEEGRPESMRRAIQAYSQLALRPEHPLYPHALYMLGWAHYRSDDLQRAVESFARLLDHYAETARRGGAPPDEDLREEALRYTVECFADPRWDGVQRAREWFDRPGTRSYQSKVFARLGEALYDQARFPAAAEAFQQAIARDPLAPDAPRLQARIVLAWSRERRPSEEARARDVLLTAYDESGAWWQKNQGDAELVRWVREYRRSNLAGAAALHHARAQELRRAGQAAAAIEEYRLAERGYAEYLRLSPGAREAYDLSFARADCAYQAGDFRRAAELYQQVRDDPAGSSHRAEAALDAVLSWQAEVARARKAGQLEDRRLLLSKDRPGAPPPAEPLPPELAALVQASDAFVSGQPRHEQAPSIAFQSGEIYFKYNQWDEARRRLADVAARWPRSEVAQYAANLVIETHIAQKDWSAVEAASAQLRGQVGAQNQVLAGSLQEMELGGRFQRAMGLMEQGRCGEAAELFAAVAEEGPRSRFADKALHNAAVCRERERDTEGAARFHDRLVSGYPGSPFADESLFRLAAYAEGRFSMEEAVERYQRLLEKYPASKLRKEALFNSGRCLESLQRYDQAAAAFARYVELYPQAEDGARTLFHAAVLQEKAGSWAGAARTLRAFGARFGQSGERELLVRARLELAISERNLGHDRTSRTEYAAAVSEFTRLRLDPGAHPLAAAAAAEARFRLAEMDLERFDRIALPATTDPKLLKKALEQKLAELKKVAPQYNEVKLYKRPDWTLAAFYRQAYLLEQLARTLFEAPVPPEYQRPGKEEYLAAYQDQLARVARPYEEEAVQVYVQAYAAARELRVKNEWTRRTAEALARHLPKEYPLFREPRGRMLRDPLPACAGAAPRAPGEVGPARALLAQGRLDEAEREARQAASRADRDVASLVTLARVFAARGRLELAAAVLDGTQKAHPQDASVWNETGFVEVGLGRRLQALEAWKKAAELDPDCPSCQVNLGQALVEAGDPEAAARALESAVKRAPECAVAWLDLGNARRGNGQAEEAQRAYERALAIDPKLSDAHFDLALLYLDGERPGLATSDRLERALGHLDRFAADGGRDPSLDQVRTEAQVLLDRERRRLAREAVGGPPRDPNAADVPTATSSGRDP